MHVTSRITQASLPTEQCPNLMSMQSITQSQIITALELCPAHLPKQLHFCFQWLAPKLFWQMSHYLSTHDSFDRKKRALCDIHHSTTIKKQLFPAGCCSQRARAQHTNPCVRLSQVTACADQHLETPLKQRDRAGSPGPPCQVFPCLATATECQTQAAVQESWSQHCSPTAAHKSPQGMAEVSSYPNTITIYLIQQKMITVQHYSWTFEEPSSTYYLSFETLSLPW